MSDALSTLIELTCVALVTVGTALVAGFGWAFIVAGVLGLVLSWVVNR